MSLNIYDGFYSISAANRVYKSTQLIQIKLCYENAIIYALIKFKVLNHYVIRNMFSFIFIFNRL